jgi:hypothetical protein
VTDNTAPFDLFELDELPRMILAAVADWPDEEERAWMVATMATRPGRCLAARREEGPPEGVFSVAIFDDERTIVLLRDHRSALLRERNTMGDLN